LSLCPTKTKKKDPAHFGPTKRKDQSKKQGKDQGKGLRDSSGAGKGQKLKKI
jgi:hypothetical protein